MHSLEKFRSINDKQRSIVEAQSRSTGRSMAEGRQGVQEFLPATALVTLTLCPVHPCRRPPFPPPLALSSSVPSLGTTTFQA